MKKFLCLVCAILLVVLLHNAVKFGEEYMSTESKDGKAVMIEIPKGAAESTIAKILKENNLIDYEVSFRLKMKTSPYRGKLNYGKFKLHEGMCIDDIIGALLMPSVKKEGIKLTIPEGYSAEMIAARCESLGLVTADEFLRELEEGKFDYAFIKDIPRREGVKYHLQGYLFPSTYEFNGDASAHEIIDTLLGEFEKQYKKVCSKNTTDMSMDEIISAAALVEREAKIDPERRTISGVIQNRIKKGMLLQIDASVVYVITNGLYDVTRVLYKDLEVDSPYNTYKYKGLPAGAICNPGIESIIAAMTPEKHTYLYYHTDEKKQDGSHIFTETFKEHTSGL